MISSDSVIPIPLLLFALTLAWGCEFAATGSPAEVQERERFISAYVDLRVWLLRMRTTQMGDAVRDSLLAAHDVTEDELLNFVDTHGTDVEFMRDVWNDIETRIATRREGDVGSVR